MSNMTVREQDMQRAHYFALGALHDYRETDKQGLTTAKSWDAIFALATGFAHHYTQNVWRGLWNAWDEYEDMLRECERAKRTEHVTRHKPINPADLTHGPGWV